MSNNKQNSVEWLVKELNQKIDFIPMNKWDEIKEVIEQAKAMHKEECKESYYESLLSNFQTFEQYYNETYGDNK
jgi:hypothetical protein